MMTIAIDYCAKNIVIKIIYFLCFGIDLSCQQRLLCLNPDKVSRDCGQKNIFSGWKQSHPCLDWPDAQGSRHLALQAGQHAKLCWVIVQQCSNKTFFEVAATPGSAGAGRQQKVLSSQCSIATAFNKADKNPWISLGISNIFYSLHNHTRIYFAQMFSGNFSKMNSFEPINFLTGNSC